jgi:hypothetical protein
MSRRAIRALAILLVAAAGSVVTAQNSSELKAPGDISGFMQSYYLHPQPGRIGAVIDALPASGILKSPSSAPPLMGFFSEIFAANPNLLPEWQTHIAKQDDQAKAMLDQALKLSQSGGVLNSTGHSAQWNDAYWGAFFATGNPKFVDKIVDQLRYFDERTDEALFLSGATAMWSLATNSHTYTAVRSAIDSAKVNADKRTQELIAQLLTDDPARIKQEIAEVVKTQRDAGRWK